MKLYCSLKQHGKHRISCVILCWYWSAALCVAHPVHTMSTHQHNLPGDWVFWKEEGIPVFVLQSRKGNECFISWLCGFVASGRICSFVSRLQNLLSGGIAGDAGGNTGNVSSAEEETWGFSSLQTETQPLRPRDQYRLLLALFHTTRSHPTFFTLLQDSSDSSEAHVNARSPPRPVQPCVRKRQESLAQRLVKHSDNWQQQTPVTAWCHVQTGFLFGEGQLCLYHVLLREISSP